METVSVIILNYNTPDVTKQAIEALVKNQGDFDVQVILIDNGSREKLIQDEWFHRTVHTYIENDTNKGFAAAVNQGIQASTGEYIFLLNSDAFMNVGTLSGLVTFLKGNEPFGIVGPKTVYADQSFQISAGRMPSLWGEFLVATKLYKIVKHSLFLMESELTECSSSAVSVDWVSGGCMMMRRALIERIGTFDEHFFFGVEDMDYCYRAKKDGFQVGYLPGVDVVHLHSYSSGGTRTRFKLDNEALGKEYFFRKHFPRKVISRLLVSFLYRTRIGLLKLSGKLK